MENYKNRIWGFKDQSNTQLSPLQSPVNSKQSKCSSNGSNVGERDRDRSLDELIVRTKLREFEGMKSNINDNTEEDLNNLDNLKISDTTLAKFISEYSHALYRLIRISRDDALVQLNLELKDRIQFNPGGGASTTTNTNFDMTTGMISSTIAQGISGEELFFAHKTKEAVEKINQDSERILNHLGKFFDVGECINRGVKTTVSPGGRNNSPSKDKKKESDVINPFALRRARRMRKLLVMSRLSEGVRSGSDGDGDGDGDGEEDKFDSGTSSPADALITNLAWLLLVLIHDPEPRFPVDMHRNYMNMNSSNSNTLSTNNSTDNILNEAGLSYLGFTPASQLRIPAGLEEADHSANNNSSDKKNQKYIPYYTGRRGTKVRTAFETLSVKSTLLIYVMGSDDTKSYPPPPPIKPQEEEKRDIGKEISDYIVDLSFDAINGNVDPCYDSSTGIITGAVKYDWERDLVEENATNLVYKTIHNEYVDRRRRKNDDCGEESKRKPVTPLFSDDSSEVLVIVSPKNPNETDSNTKKKTNEDYHKQSPFSYPDTNDNPLLATISKGTNTSNISQNSESLIFGAASSVIGNIMWPVVDPSSSEFTPDSILSGLVTNSVNTNSSEAAAVEPPYLALIGITSNMNTNSKNTSPKSIKNKNIKKRPNIEVIETQSKDSLIVTARTLAQHREKSEGDQIIGRFKEVKDDHRMYDINKLKDKGGLLGKLIRKEI